MEIAATWWTVVLPAVIVIGATLGWGIFHPRSTMMGPVLFRAPGSAAPGSAATGSQPRVALTFDDGPTPDSTPAVLDALRDLDAPATFFVVGVNADRHPDLLRRIDAEGHLVGNHTLDHSRQGLWGRHVYWRRQMEETGDIIYDLIGKRPALFRPPMGYKHWHLMYQARQTGHHVVTWSRRAFDTAPPPWNTPRRIVKRLVKAGDGEVLLLHDGHEPTRPRSRRTTADAVIPLVNQLRDRGYEIVRLDELLGVEGYQ